MDRNTPAYCRGYLAATYKAYWRCRNIHSCYNIYTAINSFLKTAALLLRKRLSKPILVCGSQLLRDQRRFENVFNVSNMIEIIHTYSVCLNRLVWESIFAKPTNRVYPGFFSRFWILCAVIYPNRLQIFSNRLFKSTKTAVLIIDYWLWMFRFKCFVFWELSAYLSREKISTPFGSLLSTPPLLVPRFFF